MTDTLPRSSPADQEVSADGVRDLMLALEDFGGVLSAMLVRHGSVVAERWWEPGSPEIARELWSLSKSFTSSAIGLAISEGRLALTDRVIDLLADDAPPVIQPRLADVTVRHLLTMNTGHAAESMPDEDREREVNWVHHILEQPLVFEPGTHFQYNSGASYLLSAIIQRLTGETLLGFLTPRLLEPLGIRDVSWLMSPQGINTGGWGLTGRTEDIARFGQLYLQGGAWNGRQVLPSEWVREATRKQVSNGDPAEPNDWSQGYGYQFWRCRNGAFRGDGKLGQFCVVMPEQDAVLALTGDQEDMQGELDLVWQHLLPAFD